MKKGIGALIIFAAIPFFVHAYVSPGKATGFVNDFAEIISTEQKIQLETTLSNFQKQTGNEIAIVTVNSLDGDVVQVYANKLFNEWGIGDEDKDNGLLILHAPNERQVWIEVGYGLEPYITDAKASSVYRNILSPEFKKGDYFAGYSQAIEAIIATIGGEVDAIPKEKTNGSGFFTDWFTFIVFIPIWLVSILGRSKSWWLGGVLGAIVGGIISFIFGFFFVGIIAIPVLVIIGLIFDFIVSKAYSSSVARGVPAPWWAGGGHRGSGGFGGSGGSSGSFGGFGGGSSGGGGGGGGY